MWLLLNIQTLAFRTSESQKKEMSYQDMVNSRVDLSGGDDRVWGGSNLRSRVDNRHAGGGLTASLVQERHLECPVWYKGAFVTIVCPKWSC